MRPGLAEPPATVLAVDRHPLFVEGFRRLLDRPAGAFLVSGAHDRRDALRALNDTRWKVVILDGGLPGEQSIQLLADLRARAPSARVLWLAPGCRDPWLRRAMEGGAAGVAHRSQSPDGLRTAVETVLRGRDYVCDALTRSLIFQSTLEAEDPHHRLTDRELQVLRLLGAGWEPREIGRALAISVKTVATHRARVQRKLGCANRAQAMAYAIAHGLASDGLPA